MLSIGLGSSLEAPKKQFLCASPAWFQDRKQLTGVSWPLVLLASGLLQLLILLGTTVLGTTSSPLHPPVSTFITRTCKYRFFSKNLDTSGHFFSSQKGSDEGEGTLRCNGQEELCSKGFKRRGQVVLGSRAS